MEEEPERLAEIKGISERKAREIARAGGRKEGYAESNDLSSAVWDFFRTGSKDLFNRYRQCASIVSSEKIHIKWQMISTAWDFGLQMRSQPRQASIPIRISGSGAEFSMYCSRHAMEGHIYLPETEC